MLAFRAARLQRGGETVLRDIDLNINAGERIVILGASGAGKTTLLQALYASIGASAALIPQPHGLVGPLSARQNIALGRIDQLGLWGNLRSLCWMPAQQAREIDTWSQPLDLGRQLHQSADSLSGGQQSRVAIARALYRGGPVVLADEPCAALDPDRAGRALQAIRDRFATLVCSMHDVEAGLALASRILAIADGRVVYDGTPAAVTDRLLEQLYQGHIPQPAAPAVPTVIPPRGCS